jgi:hypothetical protein
MHADEDSNHLPLSNPALKQRSNQKRNFSSEDIYCDDDEQKAMEPAGLLPLYARWLTDGPVQMIHEDGGSRGKGSPAGERRSKKAMKIQSHRWVVPPADPHARASSQRGSFASPSSSPGIRLSEEEDSSETEGEFSPANSGVDPEFLRKIKRKTELNKLDQEVVRLIGQHLCDVGLRTSADVLMKEAGCRLDQPTAATFRHCVMKGDWTGAVNVLEELAPHLDSPASQTEMRFLLLEQKFLEHLQAGSSIEALKVLQLELTPLAQHEARTHALSAMLMQPRPARSSPRHSPPGSPDPRAAVMERLQEFLPPSVMLPPRRLTQLLGQAAQHQQANCLFHNRRSDSGPPDTYATDHHCSKDMFPSETLQVQCSAVQRSEAGCRCWASTVTRSGSASGLPTAASSPPGARTTRWLLRCTVSLPLHITLHNCK